MREKGVVFLYNKRDFFVPFQSQKPQNEDKRTVELSGHVGFDSLPDQLVSKSVANGFCFNILCVGKLTQQFKIHVGQR